ncbi:hypothetical protein D3C81_2127740 [compost metagenome]
MLQIFNEDIDCIVFGELSERRYARHGRYGFAVDGTDPAGNSCRIRCGTGENLNVVTKRNGHVPIDA